VIRKLEVLRDTRNSAIGRREITALAFFDGGTPSRQEVIETLTKELQAPKERLAVVKIDPQYGSRTAIIRARVYDDQQLLKLMEPQYILARLGLVEAKKRGGPAK
jgi:ribosomal protein S24E